ncbi:MAG: thioredoxin [Chloroflexi bacterium]|nr:thioredoxin [Chloroflexota bacterium]
MSNLVSLQKTDFESKVLRASLPVVLDFGAEWCAPCKRLAPIIDGLAGEWAGKASFFAVDADSNSDLVGKFQVMSLPTIIVIKNGNEVARTVGLQAKEKLVELIFPHL